MRWLGCAAPNLAPAFTLDIDSIFERAKTPSHLPQNANHFERT